MSVESLGEALLWHAGAWTEEDYFALGEAGVASALLLGRATTTSGMRTCRATAENRIVKHGEYAEAGIAFYVRVDLHLGADALPATVYELVDGEYAELAHAADGVLRLERPWPVEIDLRTATRG